MILIRGNNPSHVDGRDNMYEGIRIANDRQNRGHLDTYSGPLILTTRSSGLGQWWVAECVTFPLDRIRV